VDLDLVTEEMNVIVKYDLDWDIRNPGNDPEKVLKEGG
jgi:hypothetical protein